MSDSSDSGHAFFLGALFGALVGATLAVLVALDPQAQWPEAGEAGWDGLADSGPGSSGLAASDGP